MTIMRCFYCNSLVLPKHIADDGSCFCGSRKMRPAFNVTDAEVETLKEAGVYDPANFATTSKEAWVEDNA